MHSRIDVPDEAIEYILFQRTEYLRLARSKLFRVIGRVSPFPIYNRAVKLEAFLGRRRVRSLFNRDMGREYASIRPHLPEKCGSLLDIGCGMAGIDVLLHEHYRPADLEIHLLDKTQVEKSVYYGFEPTAAAYNSLDVARTLLISNGISERRIHPVEATPDNRIPIEGNVDLVISLISWGFHYPISTYLDRVREILAPGGSLIVDVRNDTDGRDLLEARFGALETVRQTPKSTRVLATR